MQGLLTLSVSLLVNASLVVWATGGFPYPGNPFYQMVCLVTFDGTPERARYGEQLLKDAKDVLQLPSLHIVFGSETEKLAAEYGIKRR